MVIILSQLPQDRCIILIDTDGAQFLRIVSRQICNRYDCIYRGNF